MAGNSMRPQEFGLWYTLGLSGVGIAVFYPWLAAPAGSAAAMRGSLAAIRATSFTW